MWPEKNADETTPKLTDAQRSEVQKMFELMIDSEGRAVDADLDKSSEQLHTQSPKLEEKKRQRLNRWFRDTYAAQFAHALEDQKNRCAICLVPFTDADRPRVDHCHKSKKFRGLLCNRCNPALGMFGDNPELLRRAAAYLEKFSS